MADFELFNGTNLEEPDSDHRIAMNKPSLAGAFFVRWDNFKNLIRSFTVSKDTDQSISGNKTFTGIVNVQAPTSDNNPVTLKYFNDNAGGGGGTLTFDTSFELTAYLTNPDREAGQLATCLDLGYEDVILRLSNDTTKWEVIEATVYATQEQAIEGIETSVVMNPLRSAQQWVYNVLTRTFEELTTASKTIIGAINELKTNVIKLESNETPASIADTDKVRFKSATGYFNRTLLAIKQYVKSGLKASEVANDSTIVLSPTVKDAFDNADCVAVTSLQDTDMIPFARANGAVSENKMIDAVNAKAYFQTDLSQFYSHSSDTSIHFTKNSINFSDLGSSAHTHTIADTTNLQTTLNSKLNLSGGTLTGGLTGTTIAATTLSATTYVGVDTSEVVNVSNLSGNTVTDVFNSADAVEVMSLASGDMIALARMNGAVSENKMIDVDNAKPFFETDLSPFYSHSADTSIHFTKSSINLSDLGNTAHTHTVSEISDFYNASYSASYNVTSWQEIVDILAVSTVPNSVVFNVMNDIVGGTLQTYAHNIIIRGCKVTAPSTFSILGFENGVYNINFESLFYINNECVIAIGDSLLTTTTNVKFKDITSLRFDTSANYNLQCLTIGTGTTASIEYNALTNTKLDTSATLVPTQNNNYYKWNYYYDIYMFNIDSEIHFLCDRAGKFSVRCRYLCSTTSNRTITLIPPLPLKLNLHDLVTSAIETLGSYPNPIIYGTETINKFRYDTEPLSYGSSGTIFTDLNDKIEYRNNVGIGSAQYTDTGGIVDITTSGLTLELNYSGNASGYVKKEIVITGIINRKLQ